MHNMSYPNSENYSEEKKKDSKTEHRVEMRDIEVDNMKQSSLQ